MKGTQCVSTELLEHSTHWADIYSKETVNLFASILSREADFVPFSGN